MGWSGGATQSLAVEAGLQGGDESFGDSVQ